jgi:hypothetical protein
LRNAAGSESFLGLCLSDGRFHGVALRVLEPTAHRRQGYRRLTELRLKRNRALTLDRDIANFLAALTKCRPTDYSTRTFRIRGKLKPLGSSSSASLDRGHVAHHISSNLVLVGVACRTEHGALFNHFGRGRVAWFDLDVLCTGG